MIFLFSNTGAAICYYLMGQNLLTFGHLNFIPCLFAQLAFYFLTETLPLISFIGLQNKFVEINGMAEAPAAVANQNDNQNNDDQEEANGQEDGDNQENANDNNEG